MGGSRPGARVVLRYVLFQLPLALLVVLVLWGLHTWTEAPAWVLWAIGGAWVAKDLILFPFVWRSYTDEQEGYSYSPVGREATVVERLEPGGRVKLEGAIWRAELEDGTAPVDPGAAVRITGMEGLTLRVRPATSRTEREE